MQGPWNNTVAVAMSGGVDSSTVAALLRAEGVSLVGLTLQLWNQRRFAGKEGVPEQVSGRCCSLDDVYDARRVAEDLAIPYYVVNEEQRFEEDVVRPFVSEYLRGRTPIPCSLCNNHLKFDRLLQIARGIGADRIATGHYARNSWDSERERWVLRRPIDRQKDQTYFLFGLTQEQLSRTLFPLGEYTKPVVRELAAAHGLRLAQKPDSQEICFVPGGDYKLFIEHYLEEQERTLPNTAGAIVSSEGAVLGEHAGIHNFTVGQRKGLGVHAAEPLYVLGIDAATNTVSAGPEPLLRRSTFTVQELNWVSIDRPTRVVRVDAKIRHRHEPAPATLRMLSEDCAEVTFDDAQRAVTPGQAAVFYLGDEVAGGGWIV